MSYIDEHAHEHASHHTKVAWLELQQEKYGQEILAWRVRVMRREIYIASCNAPSVLFSVGPGKRDNSGHTHSHFPSSSSFIKAII